MRDDHVNDQVVKRVQGDATSLQLAIKVAIQQKKKNFRLDETSAPWGNHEGLV
jgi:hypothetical protein